MKTTLAMLAVTAMRTGVCIAGVRSEAPAEWIRPVREFGSVLLGDITYPTPPGSSSSSSSSSSPSSFGSRRVMRPFDLAELALVRARPDPPHVEDYTCDFVHSRPRLMGTVPEERRAALLASAASTIADVWRRHTCSLGTLHVDDLSATFTLDTYTGKYEARIAFAGIPPGVSSVACTDLKWRALGRRLLATEASSAAGDTRTVTLAGTELSAALGGARDYWIVMGTARAFNGQHWPLVVGVNTLPDYEAEVDYTAL